MSNDNTKNETLSCFVEDIDEKNAPLDVTDMTDEEANEYDNLSDNDNSDDDYGYDYDNDDGYKDDYYDDLKDDDSSDFEKENINLMDEDENDELPPTFKEDDSSSEKEEASLKDTQSSERSKYSNSENKSKLKESLKEKQEDASDDDRFNKSNDSNEYKKKEEVNNNKNTLLKDKKNNIVKQILNRLGFDENIFSKITITRKDKLNKNKEFKKGFKMSDDKKKNEKNQNDKNGKSFLKNKLLIVLIPILGGSLVLGSLYIGNVGGLKYKIDDFIESQQNSGVYNKVSIKDFDKKENVKSYNSEIKNVIQNNALEDDKENNDSNDSNEDNDLDMQNFINGNKVLHSKMQKNRKTEIQEQEKMSKTENNNEIQKENNISVNDFGQPVFKVEPKPEVNKIMESENIVDFDKLNNFVSKSQFALLQNKLVEMDKKIQILSYSNKRLNIRIKKLERNIGSKVSGLAYRKLKKKVLELQNKIKTLEIKTKKETRESYLPDRPILPGWKVTGVSDKTVLLTDGEKYVKIKVGEAFLGVTIKKIDPIKGKIYTNYGVIRMNTGDK